MISLILILSAYPFLSTDSMVPDNVELADAGAGSAELFYSHESRVFEDAHYSLLFSGGPLAYSDTFREMCYWGFGVDLELRRYKNENLDGFFIGGNSNAKVMWKMNSDRRESVTLGLKFGWKQDFHRYGIHFDIEPYCNPGVMVNNDSDEEMGFTLKPIVNFGMRIAVY